MSSAHSRHKRKKQTKRRRKKPSHNQDDQWFTPTHETNAISLDQAKTLAHMMNVPLPTKMAERVRYYRILMNMTHKLTKHYQTLKTPPPDNIIRDAMNLRTSLQFVRCQQWEITNQAEYIKPTTKITDSTSMWLCCAALASFAFGFTNANYDLRTPAYEKIIEEEKNIRLALVDTRLILYDHSIFEYSQTQLYEAYAVLRSRWNLFPLMSTRVDGKELNLLGENIRTYFEMLDIRAGYLAIHLGSCETFDLPQHRTITNIKIKNIIQYVVNERFLCDYDSYDYVLRRSILLITGFSILTDPYDIGGTLEGNPLWGKKQKLIWKNQRKQHPIPCLFNELNGESWLLFKEAIQSVADATKGKKERRFFKNSIVVECCVPLGDDLAYNKWNRTTAESQTLLAAQFPSMGVKYRHNSLTSRMPSNYLKDLLARTEKIHFGSSLKEISTVSEREKRIFKFRDPISDFLCFYIFDLLIAIYTNAQLQWKAKFFVPITSLAGVMNRLNNTPYPKVVQSNNIWYIYHNNMMYQTTEAAIACFTWCYIIYYNYDSTLYIEGRTLTLDEWFQPMFSSGTNHRLLNTLGVQIPDDPNNPSDQTDHIQPSDIIEFP